MWIGEYSPPYPKRQFANGFAPKLMPVSPGLTSSIPRESVGVAAAWKDMRQYQSEPEARACEPGG